MVLGVAAVAVVLVAHAVLTYGSFREDDAFISARYAKRLLHGQGLTWSDGDRVEGYTNLFWVLVIAAGSGLTRADAFGVARTLGVASAVAATVGLFWSQPPRSKNELWPVLGCTLGPALSTGVAAWAMGGLEEPLVAALVVWAIVLAYPALESESSSFASLWPASLCLAFATITRADGFLFAAACAIGFVLGNPRRSSAWAGALKLLLVPLAFLLVHLAFRRAYYDAWVPNTVHAKVALGWNRVKAGWLYLAEDPRLPVTGLALKAFTIAAALRDPFRRRRILLGLTPLVSWVAYVVIIGGDTMPAHRHLVVPIFLSTLLDIEGLTWLCELPYPAALIANIAATIMVLQTGFGSLTDPERDRVLSERWESDGQRVGLFLNGAFKARQAVLAVDAAGATPYFSDLNAVDMLGLNDRYIALHPPTDMGSGPLAHELGDGIYVSHRKPDLVLFHVPPGRDAPQWRGGQELVATPDFGRLYRLVRFKTPGAESVVATLWARAEEGRIGIERSPNRVMVPGFLLTSAGAPFAEFDESGKLGAFLPRGQSTSDFSLALDPGTWTGTVDADGEAGLSVAADPRGSVRAGAGVRFTVASPSAFGVRVEAASAKDVHVRSITFARDP